MSEESLLKNYGDDIDSDKFKEFIWKSSMEKLKEEFDSYLRLRNKRYYSDLEIWQPAQNWQWSSSFMSDLPKEITFQHLEDFLKKYEQLKNLPPKRNELGETMELEFAKLREEKGWDI